MLWLNLCMCPVWEVILRTNSYKEHVISLAKCISLLCFFLFKEFPWSNVLERKKLISSYSNWATEKIIQQSTADTKYLVKLLDLLLKVCNNICNWWIVYLYLFTILFLIYWFYLLINMQADIIVIHDNLNLTLFKTLIFFNFYSHLV